MKVSAGPGFRFSEVDDVGLGWEEFATLSFPAQLELDMSDDLLDPTRGFRLKLFLGPYWELLDMDTTFLKVSATCSHYLPLFRKPSLMLATRGAIGGLWGAERDSVAPDLRFYAGGGGSVQGFPYQSVSPLRSKDKPIGPLRLDMGVPINRREGIDDWVQIYVSIGQVF